MNNKQWWAIQIALMVFMGIFMWEDYFWNSTCSYEDVMNKGDIDNAVVVSCVKAEIYDPFIMLFGLSAIFLIPILRWLGKEKK